MKFLFKSFLLVILFLISLIVFTSKEQLYFLGEKQLKKYNVILSNEHVEDKALGLDVSQALVYYDGINSAYVDKIDLTTYLFFSSLDITNVRVSKSFEKMFPLKINNIKLEHSFLSYDRIKIDAKGEFGSFAGEVLLFENKILGELKPSKKLSFEYRNVLNQFRLQDGKYRYEYKF